MKPKYHLTKGMIFMIKLNLCRNKCCPTVELVNGQLIIRDDFGGQVSLTPEQFQILVDNFALFQEEIKQKAPL